MNILVADDNVINNMYIERILKKKGILVQKAVNGEEALALMDGMRFDAALIDIQMPALDGIETVKRIRKEEQFKDIYIAALTGFAENDDIEFYLQIGFDEILIKPIDDYALYKFIDRVLEAKPGLQS